MASKPQVTAADAGPADGVVTGWVPSPASGLAARGYSWPPFEPGNEVPVTHGARSERRFGPVAEMFAAALLGDRDTPDYVREPSYKYAVAAWARAEAIVLLMSEWLSGMDVEAALTEVTEEESEETVKRGRTKRMSRGRRVASVADQLHKHETRAMQLRARLGLDPLSRARLGKDVASQRLDLARLWAEEDRANAKDAEGSGDGNAE